MNETKKIRRRLHKSHQKKVRQLRQLARLARANRMTEIPDWLFYELPTLVPEPEVDPESKCIEEVTIDMVRRLHGQDRVNMLRAYHEWKARQMETDKKIIRRQSMKIWKIRKIRSDPDWYENYLLKKKGCPSYKKKYSKKYLTRKKKDKAWVEKQRAASRASYHKHKDKWKQYRKDWYIKNRKEIVAKRKELRAARNTYYWKHRKEILLKLKQKRELVKLEVKNDNKRTTE